MMILLLVVLLFVVLQFAVFMYARNVVAASVAAAARYGATAPVDGDTGATSAKATSSIRSGLGPRAAGRIACLTTSSVDASSGLRVVRVECAGPLRMIVLPFA